MLTPKAQYSTINAKEYFEQHLCAGDYYSQGERVLGHWHGKAAEQLGLSGITRGEEFLRLCDNLHPQTGERLTLRQKTTRLEVGPDGEQHQSANRRVFYDFTISPPKSVSIAALAGGDSRIVEAHEQAVKAALTQLETFAATRVRKGGQSTDRLTGNIVAATFMHDTSRALDPHLHTHCIVFNATFDPVEKQWKALQNHDMLVAQKFVENVYYHELARDLRRMGYAIENRKRGDFEIKGVSPALVERFSKRHRQIDEKTRQLLASEPEKAGRNLAEIREHIAHKDRERKVKDLGLARLQALWNEQLSAEEKASLRQLTSERPVAAAQGEGVTERAVAWAEDHLFERRSVVAEHELWRHALEHARGQEMGLAEIQAHTRQRAYVRNDKQPGKVTIREILRREMEIISMAKECHGQCVPLSPDVRIGDERLDDEQRKAVEQILSSRDFVTLFRGGAGTGKSFTLGEVQRGLQRAGHTVQVVAPQRQQVMDLEKDGFTNTETVSAFLSRRDVPRGAVVLVDEAGQIGGKQMHALLTLVRQREGRLILSGDTRQHGAVEATDALRAIEQHAGLHPIELTNIRRQDPKLAKSRKERERIRQYRKAVAKARDHRLAESFNRLDRMGAIVPCTVEDRYEKLSARYLELAKEKQSTVVVSQSWGEIHAANDQIRSALKREKLVSEKESVVITHQPVDLTEAQKRDPRSYNDNSVLVFNRKVKGFAAGDCAQFRGVTETHLVVEIGQKAVSIPFKHLGRVSVCERKDLTLSAGDRLQLKANGWSVEGNKLANGELATVKEIHEDGRISLADGRTLAAGFRQFVRGYAVTSYASQGKSVGHVLFSDSALKAATSDQQWYVTISRGKKGVHVFTTDKEQLRENITRSGDRPLAVDLVAPRLRNSWFYELLEKRFGKRAAQLITFARQRRIAKTFRERQAQQVKRSPDIGMGM